MQDPHKSGTRTNTKSESCNDDEKNERPEFTQEELQAAMDKLKEGKGAEDIKTCDDTTKELTSDKADFQRSNEARRLHTRSMEKNTYDSDVQKR